MGFLQGFYGKPRVDLALLRQHSEGLIALSACLAGEIPRRLRAGDYDGAKAYALELSGIFGPEHFYLELQDHGIPEQREVNQRPAAHRRRRRACRWWRRTTRTISRDEDS